MTTCEACRTLPAVVVEGYTPQGTYETIADLKTYVTGSSSAPIGIIGVYDIFGYSNQTLQGADMLSKALDAVVLVPDFFRAAPAAHSLIPPDTDEKKAALAKFRETTANVPRNVEALRTVVQEAEQRFSAVKAWGAYGLCWGGKITVLASGAGTLLTASGQAHPGAVDVADAEKLTIPHIVLASKDEPAEGIAGYKKIIDSSGLEGYVETYATMHHGWMGARARLAEEENCKEFTRGYTQLANFFAKQLKQ